MKTIFPAAAAVLLLAAWPAASQDFSAERLSQGVRSISSDAFAGRYPGEIGEGLTLGWLQARYETLGLEPGGPDGQWLQPVDLVRYEPARPPAAAWHEGGAVHTLAPGTDILLRAVSNDGRAAIAGAPVVFAGYGVHAPERNWDDYGDLDVEGAVVVVLSGEPDGDLFNGEYRTAHASNSAKAAEAWRRGAVGVLVLEADEANWARQARFNDRSRSLSPGNDDLEFSGTVSAATFAAWAEAAGGSADDLTGSADGGGFRAAALPGVTLDVDLEERVEVQRSWNLLARIPGTERPEETIVFSAHWDHVGVRDDAEGEDHIYNGAWDNASGTVGLVEMARELKAAGPFERSIVFLHVTAEEQGLLGAFWYAAHPVYPLETTAANINIDMLPLSGPTRDVPIFGLGQNTLEDDLQALAEAEGRYVSDDGQPEQGFYFRSDHFAFARAGVPALMPWHGVDFVDGGREAGEAAWRAKFGADYHQSSDEWSEDLDFTSAVENLTLLYRLAVDLANSDRWPSWKPASEFGAVRARSDAARR